MRAIITSKKAWFAMLLVAALAPLAYWQRTPVLTWYYVRELSGAYQENREECARRVASLDEAAVPRLLAGLRNPDALVCGNMSYALVLLGQRWGVTDPRAQHLLAQIHEKFAGFSPAGREKAILFLTRFLQQDGPRPLPGNVTRLVSDIMLHADKADELRGVALLLAAELIDCVQPGQWVDVCRDMAERGMNDKRPGTRIAAVQTLLRAPMRNEKDLYVKAVVLLADKEAVVRRAAVVALASASDVVREETLLPRLHDDDLEVQYLCEIALAKRGLTQEEIEMARDISDENPAIRMRVLHRIHRIPDLNMTAWLRQLSSDPVPAVRAAAVRAVGEHPQVDLGDRLREIAERDPSDTVRLNARYFLAQRPANIPLESDR